MERDGWSVEVEQPVWREVVNGQSSHHKQGCEDWNWDWDERPPAGRKGGLRLSISIRFIASFSALHSIQPDSLVQ